MRLPRRGCAAGSRIRAYVPPRDLAFIRQAPLIFTYPNSAQIEVWGPNGQLLFNAAVENPPVASVGTAAVAPDGSIVVGIGYARVPFGYAGGLVAFDRSGRQTRFVSTGRFMPCHLAFGPDGALWALGWQRSEIDHRAAEEGDFGMDADTIGISKKRVHLRAGSYSLPGRNRVGRIRCTLPFIR